MPIKLLSWNVNGLRACERYGFSRWFEATRADVVCLQEIKVKPDQLPPDLVTPRRYRSYWHVADKPGYSGIAIYARQEPVDVRHGLGVPAIDREGRVLAVEFKTFTLVGAYFPNSQRDHARLSYKLDFCNAFAAYCAREKERGKTLVICGDFNIAHQPIDLKNPVANRRNAGFLPEERAWFSSFLAQGYVDTFRHFNDEPDQYTWWSYRPGVRERNIGWRLDYFVIDEGSRDRLKASRHHPTIRGSDHCPIELVLKA